MQKHKGNFQDQYGTAVSGGSVYVYNEDTTTAITLYEDDGVTAKGNPVTTDKNGQFEFKADDGIYDILVTGFPGGTFISLEV